MKFIIISNRLPVTVEEKNDEFIFKESSGGLVSGMNSYLSTLRNNSNKKDIYTWAGWPGISIDNEKKQDIVREKGKGLNLHPIFVKEDVMDKFYLGFCNKTIWPLFHYFTQFTIYDEEYWLNYKFVNEKFCEEVTKIAKKDDIIWVHDYHLMLLPKLLRQQNPDAKIGFFLHIPFPSYEIFRMLPGIWRKELLEGLLGADLVGFHTYDYSKYFTNCVVRILGFDSHLGDIITPKRLIRVDTFPMGIEYNAFEKAVDSDEAKKEKIELKVKFNNTKIILSIDRLDYSKGILNRLKGFDLFLKNNPEWRERVVLYIIVVPSRTGVDRYHQMKKEIDEKVGNINGNYSTNFWTPIIYQYSFVSFNQLAGIYNISDVALITPLRDGMNLISKEYLACRTDSSGVLILSEMAGAAKELGEAVLINPNHIEEIASALKDALEMPLDEQLKRNRPMQARLRRYNIFKWADEFIQELKEIKKEQKNYEARLMDEIHRKNIINQFKNAQGRILFLDYDGTLVPFARNPQSARPVKELLNLLNDLANVNNTDVIIISGRDKNTLESWLGDTKTQLAAEHGLWIKNKTPGWIKTAELNNEWKSSIYPMLETYADQLPGAFIEEKDFSLVWHYRNADPDQGHEKANELIDDLVNITSNLNLQVLQGNKVIEVKNTGINKGEIINHFLRKKEYDFILAIGDDRTDEDMFKALPENAFSIKVGLSASHAKYNIVDHLDVRKLIEELING